MTNDLFGAIEGGGTKFVCAVGKADGQVLSETRFPTTTPDETLGRAIQFFQAQSTTFGKLSSLGIACFGPLDPNPSSPTYGHTLATPKPGWSGVDVVGRLQAALGIPIGFDTDVNGAALGEARWGSAHVAVSPQPLHRHQYRSR